MSRPTVIIELAGDAQFSRDLAAGGVFVPGCTLQLTEECQLVVRGADHQIVVPARVVYVEEHGGTGLELIGFSTELKAQLAELAPVGPPELEVVDVPVLEEFAYDDARFGSAASDAPAAPNDRLVSSGIIELGGRRPNNTSGSHLCEGYTHGMSMVIENVRQLRGLVDDYCPGWAEGKHSYDYAPGKCRQVKDAKITMNLGWAMPPTGSALIMHN